MRITCCHNCTTRYPGCRCDEYLSQKAEHEAKRKKPEVDQYITESRARLHRIHALDSYKVGR